MQPVDSNLTRLARRVVEPMGYELVGVEHFQRGGGASTLRVYIDHARGITLEDCEVVSHQLSGVLDVEDPVPGHYDLEVSSPGLDRPLVFPEHFARFAGQRIKVRLAEKVEGRRTLEGLLLGLDAEAPGGAAVRLEADGRTWALPFAALESARLIPDYTAAAHRPPAAPGASD
jgi:ribosome maturation factor RimP